MELSARVEKDFLPYVNKPGRYTGNEYNIVIKNLDEVNLRVALAFPELYELGMSYVGFDILYHILNTQSHIWAERVYAPWLDAEELLRSKKIPLFSLESRTPLRNFDWIGFTLQYELTYSILLNMLDLAGIPLRAENRNEAYPLIIAGGPWASNPEPIADFFDAILIGDAEEAVLELCESIIDSKEKGKGKEEILLQLSKIPGIYIPSFYQAEYDQFGDFQQITPLREGLPNRIQRRLLPELKQDYYPLNPIVPLIEITHDRLSTEIMRGCTEGCRFCQAGMIYRPVRQRPAQQILQQTQDAIRSSGFNELSLLSLNSSDYNQLEWLMMKEKMLLNEQHVRFAFPSLRLDAVTSNMVEFVQTQKKTGFTFAPEAGSQRLRNVINKNIRDEDLLDTLKLLLDNGWQSVKFYFMFGLPTEKEADLYAIIDLINRCQQIASNYPDVRFNISVSPFSPKPHTPFQWERQESPEELKKKSEFFQNKLRHKHINLTWRDWDAATLETILARGGRELANVVEEAWRLGARFDAWNDGFNWEIWHTAFERFGIEWRKYLRPISVAVPVPWDHIDMGVSKSFLQDERNRAYEGQLSQDCKDYVCLGCGLQRKMFRDLVDCYRADQQKSGQSKISKFPVSGNSNESTRTNVSFGRGRKVKKQAAQPVKKKIRIRYSKIGSTRFISHLDIVRVFDRAARRANISLIYTQGYNPRPKISFGPPLSLGVASVAEYLDLEAEFTGPIDLKNKLNRVMPQGIQILMQKTIYKKVSALAAVINRWSYETYLEDFQLPNQWIDEWKSRDEIMVERIVKNESKEINIRPYVKEILNEESKLSILIGSIDGRMAKVTEVLNTLLGNHNVDYRQFLTQRTGQFVNQEDQILDPLEII